jgi:opacity protein-like surface antigen
MKKTLLLLGALSLISSAAYAKEVLPAVEEQPIVVEEVVKAQPMLRVTDVGQYLEIDNTSGGEDIGQEVHFANYVGLAYGDDWTFGFMARKAWSMDTDDGIHSGDHRLDLDVWKHFNDNFSLGFRFRNQDDFDRYYLRTKYSYGMFSGDFDIAYQSNNSEAGRKSMVWRSNSITN